MEKLGMSARGWDRMTPGNGTKSSRGQAGYTDGPDTCLGPRILMYVRLSLPSPGGSMWRPSLISEVFETRLPVRRSWPWPETWNCLKVEPCHPLGTEPSLPTSLCPAHLSASGSLSSWDASRCPDWPGPVWLVCPCGLVLHHQAEPEPIAEAPPSLPLDSPPETPTSGVGDPLDSSPSPEHPLQKGN